MQKQLQNMKEIKKQNVNVHILLKTLNVVL